MLADEMVLSVRDVKSVMVGPSAARFKPGYFSPQLLSEKYLSAHNNLAEAQVVQVSNEARPSSSSSAALSFCSRRSR